MKFLKFLIGERNYVILATPPSIKGFVRFCISDRSDKIKFRAKS